MSSEQHYDRVARTAPTQCRVMRLAHNRCKIALIERALCQAGTPIEECAVLDVACGRGGDLNKLKGCRSYVGVDSSAGALVELNRRAAEIGMPVTVHHMDASLVPVTPCNLVICNFALHYFCDAEKHMVALLDVVSASLAPGGVFCGTYERIRGASVEWGTEYHAVIGDCVDAVEWRVPWARILQLAYSRGMAVVFQMPFHLYDTDADRGISGFILQKAQARCCGTTETRSS